MRESADIRKLLQDWPHDPDQPARIIRGEDGGEILQIRTPLGLEQLEMQGRPDGARPHDLESALEFHLQRLASAEAAGHQTDFSLSAEECAELFNEGTLYYFRYLHLFQLERWAETARDTARNLRLFDFVRDHAAREEDQDYLEQWRPYLLRMHAVAVAMLALENGDAIQALKTVETALERIGALRDLDDETFAFERKRSQAALRELQVHIEQTRPVSPLERLERQLEAAIQRQEFEQAAELRDRIRALRTGQPSPQAKQGRQ